MDQFIIWCNASNSCFSVRWDVDSGTITEAKPTKNIYFHSKTVNFED